MLLPELSLVDGERLLLIGQRRPEVTHATLGSGHQMVAYSNLQASGPMIGNVEGESLLEEPKADVVLSNRVQDQSNV